MNSSDLMSLIAVALAWVLPIAAVATLLWIARSRRSETSSSR